LGGIGGAESLVGSEDGEENGDHGAIEMAVSSWTTLRTASSMNVLQKDTYDSKSAKMPNMMAEEYREGESGIAKIKRGRPKLVVGDQAAFSRLQRDGRRAAQF
jgi:hypothetical protein